MDLDFDIINKLAKDSLIRNFSFVDGVKHLVIDSELLKPLDRLMTFSELKKFGVDKVFICDDKLPKNPSETFVQWIYIVRPDIKHLRMIAQHINDDLKVGPIRTRRHILFSPQKLHICEVILEQEGVYEYISFGELELNLIQLDTNMLSMEFRDFFKNYYLHGDQTWFSSIAKSILSIESLFGNALHVHLHGNCAKSIYKLMRNLADKTQSSVNYQAKIGHLILIDRSADFVTPFSTPLNYEGLLDDVYQIQAGFVSIPNEASTEKKKILLSNEDPIFRDIRYTHITDVFKHLKDKLRDIKDIKEKQDQSSGSVSDMKNFVQNDLKLMLKYKELINNHLQASEQLITVKSQVDIQTYLIHEHNILIGKEYRKTVEFIEELINRKSDKHSALRLMILLSVTNSGLSQSDYNSLSMQFLQSYGFDNLIILNKLQKMGLFDLTDSSNMAKEDSKANLLKTELFTSKLVQQFSRSNKTNSYQNIKKRLNIIPNDASKSRNDKDTSYLFNDNYSPIICKYIDQILSTDRSNPQKVRELDELFSGEYEYRQGPNLSVRATKINYEVQKTALIYFLGGCAYNEIATLRLIAKQKGYNFYYATTGFINTSSFINTLVE